MSNTWELYYHPLAGRGEFIRIIFEDAGVPFKEINERDVLMGIRAGRDDFYPGFAPPYIKKGTT